MLEFLPNVCLRAYTPYAIHLANDDKEGLFRPTPHMLRTIPLTAWLDNAHNTQANVVKKVELDCCGTFE
jgi:hypothetical protein